jgi:hypothetical protein
MSDSQRILEKKALRNARSAFETLERDDLLKRKRQTRALWIASVPVALVLVFLVNVQGEKQPDDAAKLRRSCELDAWNARAADFVRRTQEKNPGMPYLEVEKRLERERPFLMADTAAACNANAR